MGQSDGHKIILGVEGGSINDDQVGHNSMKAEQTKHTKSKLKTMQANKSIKGTKTIIRKMNKNKTAGLRGVTEKKG